MNIVAAPAAQADTGYEATLVSWPGENEDAVYAVRDIASQTHLGRIAKCGGKRIGDRAQCGWDQPILWRVVTAGPCVKVDLDTRYDTKEAAAAAVAAARGADTLHVRGEGGLTQYERDLLDFEYDFMFVQPGSKERAVWELLDLDRTRYLQLLSNLAVEGDHVDAALRYRPTVVNRLRRLSETRRARRASRIREMQSV